MALGRNRKHIGGLAIGIVAECRKGWAAGHTRWLQKSKWGEKGFNARKLRQVLAGPTRSGLAACLPACLEQGSLHRPHLVGRCNQHQSFEFISGIPAH